MNRKFEVKYFWSDWTTTETINCEDIFIDVNGVTFFTSYLPEPLSKRIIILHVPARRLISVKEITS